MTKDYLSGRPRESAHAIRSSEAFMTLTDTQTYYSAWEWRNLLFGAATDIVLSLDNDIGSPLRLSIVQPALRSILRDHLSVIRSLRTHDDWKPNSLFHELPCQLYEQLIQDLGRTRTDAFFRWTAFVWQDWYREREWFSYGWVLAHWARTTPPALGSCAAPLIATFRDIVYDRLVACSRFLHHLEEKNVTPWDRLCLDLGGFELEVKDPEHRTTFSGWCREGIELSRLQLFWPELLSMLSDEQVSLRSFVNSSNRACLAGGCRTASASTVREVS